MDKKQLTVNPPTDSSVDSVKPNLSRSLWKPQNWRSCPKSEKEKGEVGADTPKQKAELQAATYAMHVTGCRGCHIVELEK